MRCRELSGTITGSPGQARALPLHSVPLMWSEITAATGVLAKQAKLTLHSHSAGGRDCEALPPSAGELAQLRPSLQYRPEVEQLEPSQQARHG